MVGNDSAGRDLTIDHLHAILRKGRFGVVVADLADGCITFVNAVGEEMMGWSADEIVGRSAHEFVDAASAGASQASAQALAAGAILSYRAVRTLVGRSSTRRVWIWVRRLELASGPVSVSWMVPIESATGSAPAVAFLSGDSLVLGVTDQSWRIDQLAGDTATLLGIAPSAVHGAGLLGLLHPDDAVALTDELRSVVGEPIIRIVRVNDASGAWRSVLALFIAMSDDDPPVLAFAFTESAQATVDENPAARIARLERHLQRIAAEVQAAEVAIPSPSIADAARFPILQDLSDRQWDILNRLLRNERVPGIAADLFLSQSTVRNHLTALFRKFGVHSQAELLQRMRPSGNDEA